MTGGRLIVGSTALPATVHNVHGAAGRTNWVCLARGDRLAGSWEAVEWARVPVDGVSGEHLHTRTEEIYLVLSGTAEVLLDGRPHRLGKGGMALTRIGSSHALRNVGDVPVEWLVIELLAPAAMRTVTGSDPRRWRGPWTPARGGNVASTVVDLGAVGEFDPRWVFDGPLASVRIERMGPGDVTELVAAGREHVLFVISGHGTAVSGDLRFPLSAGTSVTLPLGGRVRIEPGADGIELFRATMLVTESELP